MKSYEYFGNCYKINTDEINSDKIIINQNDEYFTIVNSCDETSKKLKINSTGECVSECPKSKNDKIFEYQNLVIDSYSYNDSEKQYIEKEELIPKYKFKNLCLENCPLDSELDEINYKCIFNNNNTNQTENNNENNFC